MNNMDIDNKGSDIKKEFLRFFSFWPYFILSVTIFLMFAYFYIRYSNYEYESLATIEILD